MKRIDIATDQRVQSVGERLPDTFYKYMRLDDEQRLEWLKRLLVDGELYFASSAIHSSAVKGAPPNLPNRLFR